MSEKARKESMEREHRERNKRERAEKGTKKSLIKQRGRWKPRKRDGTN